jgi:alpha-tubulin suppressor-like RCC1 family protein
MKNRRFAFVCIFALIAFRLATGSKVDAGSEAASEGPVLCIYRNTNSVVLTWPDSHRTFILEQTDSLAPFFEEPDSPVFLPSITPGPKWVRASPPFYTGTNFQLTVEFEPGAESGNRFFRLRESTTSIVAANYYTAVIKGDGSLWMWGHWFGGQSPSPLLIESEGLFCRLAAGDLHTLALSGHGEVWGWGDTDSGQLGIGGYITAPTKLLDSGFSKVAAGGALSLALGSDGTLWATGVIAFFPPFAWSRWRQVGSDSDWKDLAIGGIYDCSYRHPCEPMYCRAITHILALKTNGTLWAWGENFNGQLGIEGVDDQHSPVRVGTETNWVAISAGEGHSVALRSDGTIWSWGWNAFGQLGHGTFADWATPRAVGTETNWAVIAAGYRHSVALKTDGSLWAWGCNSGGQLGDGTTILTNSPTRIGAATYVAVAAGKEHTVALKSDGAIWAWGGNNFGQIGDGTTEPRLVPKEVGSVKY